MAGIYRYKIKQTNDQGQFEHYFYYDFPCPSVTGLYSGANLDFDSTAVLAYLASGAAPTQHTYGWATTQEVVDQFLDAGCPVLLKSTTVYLGMRWYFDDDHYIRVENLIGAHFIILGYYNNNVKYLQLELKASTHYSQPAWSVPFYDKDLNAGIYYDYSLVVSGNNTYVQWIESSQIGDANAWKSWIEGLPDPIDTNDPYLDIPDSEPSGPAEGAGIPQTAGIDIPGLPTVSPVDAGFINLFNPTIGQIKSLADYMWHGGFDLTTFRKLFADPMDCILGLNIVPVNVPSGSAQAIAVGNISTGINANIATSQWVELDCGTITVDLPYGNYLDYAPYSKFSLYLPYIGMVELSTDDVMGRTLTLKYHVDVLSCACVAYLKCGPDVLYQFTGSCGYSVPITGDNFRQMVASIIDIAANIGGIMTGGAAISGVASIAKDVMNCKPEIHRSGAIGSGAGLMGIQKAYLIMELPNACKPKKQYHYLGYPGFITETVNNLSGYVEFDSIILDGIGCTENERQMIEALCKGGIYV